MPSPKICGEGGCGIRIPSYALRCAIHQQVRTQEANARRAERQGSRQSRGYGAVHVRKRNEWAPKVATGKVPCFRCGHLIIPGQEWHLDHADHDRSLYQGPSHALCNVSAGGQKAHGVAPKPFPRSRDW